ncbi:hypothetical protein EVAR_42897_1 [Eumeta japonica]|uniref:Uncharacterized protein n=1 Tax=Eumeta variegata TaxID=151549 RepID=A0A4C1WX66_EUMVA|nr:hypothetical protein EVAR_42897_1 [Eumeta japonica]
MLPTFDQLVEFLKEECRLLDNIPWDLREWSSNADRQMTHEQRTGDSGCKIDTPPSLRQESKPKPHPIYAREQAAGPSRQHCGLVHPTGGGAGHIRTRGNSLRTGISGSQRTGSRSPDP